MRVLKLIYLLVLLGCNQARQEVKSSQDTFRITQKDIEMNQDKFDIPAYNKRLASGTTSFVLDDGTQVRQFHIGEGEEIEYVEEIVPPPPAIFAIYKNYYASGQLAETGQYYPRDFTKGIWFTYDENGNLVKEINYDAPYVFDFESLLAFIVTYNKKSKDSTIYLDRATTVITRGESKEGPFWYITWQYEPEYRARLTLSGITGEVVHQEKIKFEES